MGFACCIKRFVYHRTSNVINSPVTKRHRSQQRYESLGWLNNGRKRNRVYNTLRPYRILQKIPPNSFSVGFASNASYIIDDECYNLARHEATPLTTALRVVGMVKQRQKTQSCLQYFEPIAYISENTSKLIFCGMLHQTLRISSTTKVPNSPVTKRHRSQTALRVVGMVKQRQKTQSCLQYCAPIPHILQEIHPNSFSVSVASNRFVYHRRRRL